MIYVSLFIEGVLEMKIGFIGAGKVGCSFGLFLKKREFQIVGYASQSMESASYAANLTDSSALSFNELIKQSNYIFITTPDDRIEDVWNHMLDFDLRDKKVFHMSGCLSSSIFTNSGENGVLGYSLHPLYSFADKKSSDLGEVVFSIEGDHISGIHAFLDQSNIRYFVLDKKKKALYHAAAVFVSNYVVALAKIGEDLLLESGLDKELSIDGTLPLMESALFNMKKKGINHALTGPIIRGDLNTIQKHIEELPTYKEIYKRLGLVALQIGSETGDLSDKKTEEIYQILRSDCNEKDGSDITGKEI